jgi:hypothetical protein
VSDLPAILEDAVLSGVTVELLKALFPHAVSLIAKAGGNATPPVVRQGLGGDIAGAGPR